MRKNIVDMKIKIIMLLVLVAIGGYTVAQAVNERPKLVVGIVVDQMRNEYIYRYYDDFGTEGFRRLIEEGYYYSNAHFNYVPTYTAPGHASIYTGATPNVHGIVGNYWYHKVLGQSIYCTEDDAHPLVGDEGKGMSCNKLLSTTISDELKMSTNERGKVVGLSIKDRGAILPAGHMGDGAYWFTNSGLFVSSTYYMETLPSWVNEFNDRQLPLEYIKRGWQKTSGISFDESLLDDNPYEKRLGGKDKPIFPYDLTDLIKNGGIGSMRTTPYGNDLIVDLAEAAIKHEHLGQDDFVDLLAVSFSSTDYVGHSMGPRAIETQDTYIKLDRSIARLLNYLDTTIGKGEYLIFLTGDHGAAEVPQYLADRRYNVTTISNSDIAEELKIFSMEKYGENVVRNFSNFNVFLNAEVLRNLKLDPSMVEQDLIAFFMSKDYVRRVYTAQDILNGNSNDPVLKLIFNGYDPKQSGDLFVLLKPGYMDYGVGGTTHGSPYVYDTHVPLIWYGWKINPGRNYDKKFITQIAPTLAQKINISMPNGSDSEVLLEVLD